MLPPPSNPSLTQYLIGYGSLMQDRSKNKTYSNTGPNIPVLLSHFKRGWITEGTRVGFSITFLGAIEDKKSRFNAVVFKLPSSSVLADYDQRESRYCRVLVSPNLIQMLDQHPKFDGQIWIYVSQPIYIKLPSARYPIVQSYVDIFLSGCLEIEKKYHLENFADQCIETTHYWSSHWVNDRIYPRRPFVHQPNAFEIDKLIKKKLPNLFSSIKIE